MKKFTIKMFFLSCSLLLSSNIMAQRFAPTVDTYIDQTAARADKVENTENFQKLVVRKYTNTERITFLEFNIGDYKENLSKAELCMYLFNITGSTNATETIDIYEVTAGTISNDVTWNNFTGNYTLSDSPVASLSVTTGATLGTAYGWYRFDVTNFINTLAAQEGSDKKVKLALKARTTTLLLNFYSTDATSGSYNYPYFSPFLIFTPATQANLTEKSRDIAAQDGFVYSVNPDTGVDFQYLLVNFYKSGESIQRRIANLRFNIPSVALTDAHVVKIKTKIYKDQSGVNPVNVIDLEGMPNIDATEEVNINTLTWNTMPSNANDYVYLRSYFTKVEDKDNEAELMWDVTDYVKAQQDLGKTSVVFSLRVPESGLGGGVGHSLAFYARNYLNAEPTTTNIPQIILYEDDSYVSIGETEADQKARLIIDGDILLLSNGEAISGLVYTIQGAVLENVSEANNLDTSAYAKGIYLLKLQDGTTYKFVKK